MRAFMLIMVATTALATGCQTSAATLPAPPAVVDVSMREFRFDHDHDIPAGRVVFRVENTGDVDHELVMVVLPKDVPPLQEQLRGSKRLVVASLASVPVRPPGAGGTFAVDLAPGRYAFLCFVKSPDGVSHDQKGMGSEFEVA